MCAPDLVEHAVGRRVFAVTYYAGGRFDDRSGDAWKVDFWTNSCNACDMEIEFDELVQEVT